MTRVDFDPVILTDIPSEFSLLASYCFSGFKDQKNQSMDCIQEPPSMHKGAACLEPADRKHLCFSLPDLNLCVKTQVLSSVTSRLSSQFQQEETVLLLST